MRHFEIKSALLLFKSALLNFRKTTSSKMRYFSGFCMFRDHICVVRHGGQPFQYNLGAGGDVRGQTHVPARHFSLQSAYQSAGPGHSGGQRSKCPVMWLFLIHRSCLNDITGWFMKFGAKRTTQWSGQKSSSNFSTEFPQYRPPRPKQDLFSSQNTTGGLPVWYQSWVLKSRFGEGWFSTFLAPLLLSFF
jgi:hypothetical protein